MANEVTYPDIIDLRDACAAEPPLYVACEACGHPVRAEVAERVNASYPMGDGWTQKVVPMHAWCFMKAVR